MHLNNCEWLYLAMYPSVCTKYRGMREKRAKKGRVGHLFWSPPWC